MSAEILGPVSAESYLQTWFLVEERVRAHKKQYSWSSYFNNFIEHFKDSSGIRICNYIDPLGIDEFWDTPMISTNLSSQAKAMTSRLRLSQSRAQFYQVFDNVLQLEGLTQEVLQPSIDRYLGVGKNSDAIKLYALAFPAYVRLIALGYNHLDLIS